MARDIISTSSGNIVPVLSLEETLYRNQVKDVNISCNASNPLVTQLPTVSPEK